MSKQGGLPGFFKLVLFLGIAVLAYTEGWPWLQEQLGQGQSEGARCVSQAADATSYLARRMYPYLNRRADQEGWRELKESTRDRIAAARATCRCQLPSCRKGRNALELLGDLIGRVDTSVGGGNLVANPDGHVSEIERWLEEGRALARAGN